MYKEEILKKLDDKINYLEENNIQLTELENYINGLCGIDNLSLNVKLKRYMMELPISENKKMEILRTLSKYDDIFKEFCDYLLTGKIQKNVDSVCERGYTAYDILDKEPCLASHIAFLWLAHLRENDDNVEKIMDTLKSGLSVNDNVKLSYNVEKIKKYLSEKESTTDVVVKRLVERYHDHPDIANEFEYWIRKKQFIEENPVTESGYTAKRLYEEYGNILEIQGVFSLLITLREEPDKALNYIKKGFPRK